MKLSPRETQIIELLVGGLTYNEIAYQLGIRPTTIRCYMSRIMHKTGQSTPMAALAFTLLHGLVLINSA